jgi:Spy/CpxP family protein refolding chaperone
VSRTLLLALVAAVVAWPTALDAQQGPQGRRREVDRERLEQRIRAQMGRMVRERLGLDEEEATRLSAVVQDFDARRRALFVEEQATRRSVEAFLNQGTDDEAQALVLIERVTELRLQEAQLFREEQEALLDVLTPTQLLELQDLRQDLGQRIRALRGGRGGDSDRRRGGGPGPGAFRDGQRGWPPGPASGPRDAEERQAARVL